MLQTAVTDPNAEYVFSGSHGSTPAAHGLPEVGHRYTDGVATVEIFARANLPIRYGDFKIFVFRTNVDDKEHVALVRGDSLTAPGVQPTVRIHSECLTGDVLASLRCDCREQLEMAMSSLGKVEAGVLLYMRQEGRGIGLGNKIRAYTLQEQGMDTVEANRHLGFDDDIRDYRTSALMLLAFGLRSIHLATNNPRKMQGLQSHGIEVSGRVPIVVQQNPHNAAYLATKAKKSGHLLPF